MIRVRNSNGALCTTLFVRVDATQEVAMQITKLRSPEDTGLVPAGAYFKRLAADLQKANATEAARRDELDAEDRELESIYRRRSASRANTYAEMAM
jgi:hypothetical protein